MQGYL